MTLSFLIIDQYWWLIIPGVVLGLIAQLKVQAAYNHYVRVPAASGLTGAQAAREILDRAGLFDVPVHEVGGHLTDHYDPLKKALFLSSENYRGRSLAALGVAAHEAGHALQHAAAYFPMQVRQTLVPAAQFASNAAIWIGLLGWAIGFTKFALFGVIVFGIITLFQLVTLPVEFDASRRAKQWLLEHGLIAPQERSGVSKVLNAAALTYVAAMVSSLLTLLHFIPILRGSSRG
jgi:Zn-dependent membrane protease YugP